MKSSIRGFRRTQFLARKERERWLYDYWWWTGPSGELPMVEPRPVISNAYWGAKNRVV